MWLVGMVSRRRVWLECIGVFSRCFCRYPHNYSFPHSTCMSSFLAAASLLLCSCFKCFFVLYTDRGLDIFQYIYISRYTFIHVIIGLGVCTNKLCKSYLHGCCRCMLKLLCCMTELITGTKLLEFISRAKIGTPSQYVICDMSILRYITIIICLCVHCFT